jgi:hypothetical protein
MPVPYASICLLMALVRRLGLEAAWREVEDQTVCTAANVVG